MERELKGGYTTGACMAAGVKAALMFLRGERAEYIELTALSGEILTIPVASVEKKDDEIIVEIVKDAGDDPDITNGASVFTSTRLLPPGSGIVFRAGIGIGTVTKSGLSVAKGEPAINPGPRELTRRAAAEILGDDASLEVTVSIPAGAELAKKTLNPVLGIEGGISVIGTTGVLRPMSEEAFKNSLVPQISVAKEAGFDTLVFVPGKIGEVRALKVGIPAEVIVQTSNFIGFMLENAVKLGIKQLILFGHIGKLAKVAAGVFHTHNRVGDARLETLAAYCAAEGMDSEGVKKILSSVTTEEAMEIITQYKLERVYDIIAARASLRAERLVFQEMKIGTVLVSMKGDILGLDESAKAIGRGNNWKL